MYGCVKIESEKIFMSLETGEVVDNYEEACDLYSEGHDIQVMTSYRFNDGEWTPWRKGPKWEH